MAATAFSNDGSDVIQRSIEVNQTASKRATDNLETVYELPRCIQFIQSNQYKKVALQFPDDLLPDAAAVVKGLQQGTSAEIFILGDTSYGSCCVDEIAAEHCSADCIIHYGAACLSPTSRLPVLYVFGQQVCDATHCHTAFTTLFPNTSDLVLVMYDVVYTHAVDELNNLLQSTHPNAVMSKVNDSVSVSSKDSSFQIKKDTDQDDRTVSSSDNPSDKCSSIDPATEDDNTASHISEPTTLCYFGRTFTLSHPIEDYAVYYVGSEGRTLTNLMMTFNKCPFYTYNPKDKTSRKETLNVNRALMKRYYMVEKAKDASVVGIVAGTLGMCDYLTVISHLKDIMKKAGKKSYTFVVGKLNVAKLANFMEVDVFVLVSCPENSLIDSQDFYKPVVTPFEMELACNRAREWTGEYVTDFRQILPGASKHVALPTDGAAMETDVSLITGNLRRIGTRDEDEVGSESKALLKRDEMMQMVHSDAGEFLASRSWRGLEQDLGKTPVTKAVEGRKGIAASYVNEPDTEIAAVCMDDNDDGGTPV